MGGIVEKLSVKEKLLFSIRNQSQLSDDAFYSEGKFFNEKICNGTLFLLLLYCIERLSE